MKPGCSCFADEEKFGGETRTRLIATHVAEEFITGCAAMNICRDACEYVLVSTVALMMRELMDQLNGGVRDKEAYDALCDRLPGMLKAREDEFNIAAAEIESEEAVKQ